MYLKQNREWKMVRIMMKLPDHLFIGDMKLLLKITSILSIMILNLRALIISISYLVSCLMMIPGLCRFPPYFPAPQQPCRFRLL